MRFSVWTGIAAACLACGCGSSKPTLLDAVKAGNTEQVVDLISKGADVKLAGAQKATPLHYAAQQGNADIVGALLKAGADPNAY